MKKPKESDLQKQIIDWLNYHKCFVFKVNNGGVYIKKLNRYMKSPMKGVSDIIGLTPQGRFLAVEVKIGKNKPSEEQLLFMQRVCNKGGIAFWTSTLDAVIRELKDYI